MQMVLHMYPIHGASTESHPQPTDHALSWKPAMNQSEIKIREGSLLTRIRLGCEKAILDESTARAGRGGEDGLRMRFEFEQAVIRPTVTSMRDLESGAREKILTDELLCRCQRRLESSYYRFALRVRIIRWYIRRPEEKSLGGF
jgi:hypothetical protein